MRYYEFIFENVEDRINFLAKQQGNKVVNAFRNDTTASDTDKTTNDPETVLRFLAQADPTNGKFLSFIVRSYINNEFVAEDIPGIRAMLERFVANRNKIKAAGYPVDVMQYKTRSDLVNAIRSVEQTTDEPISAKKQAAAAKKEGADTVFEGPGITIKHLKNKEAACLYGRGTEWCTAYTTADNRFDSYNKQGDLYVIILSDVNRKFEFHYETDQLMDENNSPVSKKDIKLLSNYPVYTEFLNSQIKKHYGKYFDELSDSREIGESAKKKKRVTRKS